MISGISSQDISCPAHTVPAHREDSEHRQHSGDLKPGEIQDGEWNVADGKLHRGSPSLLLPSPPLSKDHSRWQRGKNSFGTRSEKSRSFPEGNGSCWGSCSSSTNPTGKGLLGVAAHPPTPPTASRDQNSSPNVPGCNSWCLPSPPSALAFPEHGLGRSPWAQGPAS